MLGDLSDVPVHMAKFGTHIEDDLQLLDIKLKQARNEYEQYFLGTRKREPYQLRGEVTKMVNIYANIHIRNTAQRFKFNNLRARFFTFRRHWDLTMRKIEEGSYERHQFKANLREREQREVRESRSAAADRAAESTGSSDLFSAYVEAREATGQGAKGLTQEKLQTMLAKQERAIREKYDCSGVKFRVVVEEGRAKLKASPIRG